MRLRSTRDAETRDRMVCSRAPAVPAGARDGMMRHFADPRFLQRLASITCASCVLRRRRERCASPFGEGAPEAAPSVATRSRGRRFGGAGRHRTSHGGLSRRRARADARPRSSSNVSRCSLGRRVLLDARTFAPPADAFSERSLTRRLVGARCLRGCRPTRRVQLRQHAHPFRDRGLQRSRRVRRSGAGSHGECEAGHSDDQGGRGQHGARRRLQAGRAEQRLRSRPAMRVRPHAHVRRRRFEWDRSVRHGRKGADGPSVHGDGRLRARDDVHLRDVSCVLRRPDDDVLAARRGGVRASQDAGRRCRAEPDHLPRRVRASRSDELRRNDERRHRRVRRRRQGQHGLSGGWFAEGESDVLVRGPVRTGSRLRHVELEQHVQALVPRRSERLRCG
jgi:hypothetical protein